MVAQFNPGDIIEYTSASTLDNHITAEVISVKGHMLEVLIKSSGRNMHGNYDAGKIIIFTASCFHVAKEDVESLEDKLNQSLAELELCLIQEI